MKAIDDERIDVTYDGKKDEEYLNLQKMEVQDAIQDLAEMDDNEFFQILLRMMRTKDFLLMIRQVIYIPTKTRMANIRIAH